MQRIALFSLWLVSLSAMVQVTLQVFSEQGTATGDHHSKPEGMQPPFGCPFAPHFSSLPSSLLSLPPSLPPCFPASLPPLPASLPSLPPLPPSLPPSLSGAHNEWCATRRKRSAIGWDCFAGRKHRHISVSILS